MKKRFFFFWHVLAAALLTFVPSSLPADSPLPAIPKAIPNGNGKPELVLPERRRETKPLVAGANEPKITQLVASILERSHYSQLPINDGISEKFFDRYIEALDNLHMHFLQTDLDEFDRFRDSLDELILKGDTSPGRLIFARFLQRVEQRAQYVEELLKSEQFDFTSQDRYNLDRRKSPHPKTMSEAHDIWRQHLRYEVLQEKLNKETQDEIVKKVGRRYSRLLRTLQEYDGDDVFELYLSSLTRVYDPHSDYLGKSQLENFEIGMKLSLYGIGALLQSEDGYCKVVSLVPGGPAAESKKLKENDRIIAVAQGETEPVDVIDLKLSKVVEMIRGAKGTEVRLTIIPADAPDPSVRKVVKLVRDKIKLEDQEAKAKLFDVPGAETGKNLRLGVIDLHSFYADFNLQGSSNTNTNTEPKSTTIDVAKLIKKLKQENVDGLILDLRRNGGGFLEEAISLTGLFIKEGPVVQVKGPTGKPSVDRDTDPALLYDGPLVVLTSRFSASASEILAGALQDYGRALIVGDSSTHGKGTVQSLVQLEPYMRGLLRTAINPGAIKITIRKFYRASGSSTQLKGIIPDIVLPSLNNLAEVGEASLDNPLVWDTIPSVPYDKLNRVQPFLEELRKRSEARLGSDQDFTYLLEDLERIKKTLDDKSVSLNEEERRKEKEEAEARTKKRDAELRARRASDEKAYEITLKNADLAGLPEPLSPTNSVAKPSLLAAESDEDEAEESKAPPVDVVLKEAKRILADWIALQSKKPSLVGAQ